MQRHLTITYRDQIIFDGPVDEFAYQDSDEAITVSGRFNPAPARPAGGGGLLEMLTSARRQQTQTVIDQKRAELDAEKQSEDDAT